MSDMITRVAKAMHLAVLPDDPWNPEDRDCAAYYEAQYKCARAAIEAMRDPTPSMVSAGMGEIPEDGSEYEDIEDAWRAMIDHALSQDTHSLPPPQAQAAKPAGEDSTPPSSPAGTNSEAQP
jgi:hypothetical protein